MKTQFLQKVSGSLSKAAFKLKKASPELLVVGGAIGVVAAAIGACCATRKLDDIIEAHKADVEKIREYENNDMIPEYTHKDAQHDLTVTYAKTSWKIVKLYAPSVLVGVASLGCMLASNQILRKRNAALAAAYTAVDGAFKKYRKNCKDADVYINPPLYDYDATDFGRTAITKMISIGEQSARQQIETLRSFSSNITTD